MSQLPDEIYVRQESKHGTLDFVTAYLYPWAFEEDGYKMEDMQMYIPSYRLQEFAALVSKMREAQEELDVFEHEHDFFEYEVIMKRKELTSKVIKLESEVDEHLKEMEI